MTTADTSPRAPHEVSRFEFHLLRVLRFFVGQLPADQGVALLRSNIAAPKCLSPVAVRLAEETLAKGCVLFLTRQGGWRNDRHLPTGEIREGRVWERVPLAQRTLTFSPEVLSFALWATAERLPGTKEKWNPRPIKLTAADELFFFLAFEACRADHAILETLRHREVFAANPFAWLANPGSMTAPDEPRPPAFDRLFDAERSVILECLQAWLANRWLNSERLKGKLSDWRMARQQGRAEFTTLQAFLAAADRAQRRDLARFVLQVNASLFTKELAPAFWNAGLAEQGPSRLAERLETQRALLAMPRQMATLEAWTESARNVSYFDEGYAASQAWKADWESHNGAEAAARARRTVEAIEPLRTDTGGMP